MRRGDEATGEAVYALRVAVRYGEDWYELDLGDDGWIALDLEPDGERLASNVKVTAWGGEHYAVSVDAQGGVVRF